MGKSIPKGRLCQRGKGPYFTTFHLPLLNPLPLLKYSHTLIMPLPMQASCLSSLHSQHHRALCPSAILCCQPPRSCLALLRALPRTSFSISHRLVIIPQILRLNLQLSAALLLQPPPLPPLRSAVRIPLRVASRAPLVREHLDPVHSPMMQCAASQDSADSPLPVSPPSRPADAVPLHHCSIRLQSLLLERPHPTGSRLHLAELLRLAAVDSSHVLR